MTINKDYLNLVLKCDFVHYRYMCYRAFIFRPPATKDNIFKVLNLILKTEGTLYGILR